MEEKKSLGKELQEKLTFTQPHIADEQPDAVAEAERFCVDYKAFLDAAKTEREAAARGGTPCAGGGLSADAAHRALHIKPVTRFFTTTAARPCFWLRWASTRWTRACV